jgi:hypothetical protein
MTSQYINIFRKNMPTRESSKRVSRVEGGGKVFAITEKSLLCVALKGIAEDILGQKLNNNFGDGKSRQRSRLITGASSLNPR